MLASLNCPFRWVPPFVPSAGHSVASAKALLGARALAAAVDDSTLPGVTRASSACSQASSLPLAACSISFWRWSSLTMLEVVVGWPWVTPVAFFSSTGLT